jgi:hypothetical protein
MNLSRLQRMIVAFILVTCVMTMAYACQSRNRVREVAEHLSIPPTVNSIISYLDTQVLVVGNNKEKVLAIINSIDPDSIHLIPNNIFPGEPYECYSIELYSILSTYVGDRLVCFDEQDKIVDVSHTLGAY